MKYTIKLTTIDIIEIDANSEEEAINNVLLNIKTADNICNIEVVKDEEI